ncbi:MAG: TRAP transporter small permease subunit [Burkholderiales bacterium]|nr:TRAP transporter small permease subunit [Burkholderiales bacterium]
MRALLRLCDAIDRTLGAVGRAAGWLFVVATATICLDVATRKFGVQLPGLGSTRLQELEWHLHAALFSLWLGAAYVRNAHVRIDTLVGRLSPRTLARLEIAGCVVFALPFCLVALRYGVEFAWTAWVRGEASVSPSGLPWRWIPKAILASGLALLALAVVSVALRRLAELREAAR